MRKKPAWQESQLPPGQNAHPFVKAEQAWQEAWHSQAKEVTFQS